ncbi:MAG: DUF1292 domain-containing protein [Ruminococcus sp.]|nr:DUF1292 domain-containing protein [Ruminococcus sp.]
MAEDIKNISPEEEEASIIVLEDDLGNEVEFEYLDVIEYEGIEYLFLIPVNEEDGNDVVILKITSIDDETESFEGIEDEELLETLFEIFKDKWKDEFNFE